MISFTLRPTLPYLRPFDEEENGRSGTIKAEKDLITMTGEIQYYQLAYESQIKVVNYNGQLLSKYDNKRNGIIEVNNADSVILYIAAGTSYQLKDSVFLRPHSEKFKGNEHPHTLISERIKKATNKGYERLRKEHIKDFQQFFNRTDILLTDEVPSIPTDKLLLQYREGKPHA